MEETNRSYNTLKLKYGEYYSLKITDSSKNVINSVEITGNQISTEQTVFSSPNKDKNSQDESIEQLMQGETRLLELRAKEELTENESDELKNLEDEFFSWSYESSR